ncbi:MAG TPA: hypothetical protein VJ123_01485 [Anaerolineales bacterium]|nr:hypothetical protein [Anaerolineales bacterium]
MSSIAPRRRSPRRRFTFPQIAFFAILGSVVIITLSLTSHSADLALVLEHVLPFLGGLGVGYQLRGDR